MTTTSPYRFRFEPGSPLAVNWILSSGFWLATLFLGGYAALIKSGIHQGRPPESLHAALLLHTPLVTNFILLAGMWLYATRARRSPFLTSIRWSHSEIETGVREPEPRHSLRIAGTFITCAAAGYGVYLLQLKLVANFPGPHTRSEAAAEASPAAAYAFASTAVMMAPLIEELFYRGILFMHAHSRAWKAGSCAFSTLAFTFVHVVQYSSDKDEIHWAAIGTMFALGLACSLSRTLSDRVWPAYVLHLSYNCSVAAAPTLFS